MKSLGAGRLIITDAGFTMKISGSGPHIRKNARDEIGGNRLWCSSLPWETIFVGTRFPTGMTITIIILETIETAAEITNAMTMIDDGEITIGAIGVTTAMSRRRALLRFREMNSVIEEERFTARRTR